jgi:hypothetical protein
MRGWVGCREGGLGGGGWRMEMSGVLAMLGGRGYEEV